MGEWSERASRWEQVVRQNRDKMGYAHKTSMQFMFGSRIIPGAFIYWFCRLVQGCENVIQGQQSELSHEG